MSSRRAGLGLFYLMLLPILGLSAIAAVGVGSTSLPWQTIAQVVGLKILPGGWVNANGLTEADTVVVWLIRLPRVLVAAIAGAGFAVGGVVMQGLFRNPLAEPGLIGAGAGAALGAIIAFVAGWTMWSVAALPVSAICGSLLALTLVYAMATRGGVTPVATLLLSGVAITALFTAVCSLLLSINIVNWQIAQEVLFWTMGGLDSRSWTHVWLCAPFVILGTLAAVIYARDLDLMQQGEETAAAFGVNVESSKRLLILIAALLTGACVGVAGTVAFVGLVVPHAVRLLLGPSHRVLLPASACAGAIFLILCDLAARTINPPTEIRLGVITSLVGGPLFIALLMRRYREASAA